MYIYVSKADFKTGEDGKSPEDGLAVYDFDQETGAFTHVQTLTGMRNPTYLARHPHRPVLYLLERWVPPVRTLQTTPEQQATDCVVAFAIDEATGTVREIGRRPTGGLSPMHIRIHPSGRFASFANPGRPFDPDPDAGHVTVMRLGEDGSLGEIVASEKDPGVPPTWRHRPKSYPHNTCADPQWRRLFVACMMADRVLVYRFDENTGALTPSEQPFVQTSSGSGPRHMAFHPSGRFFYTVNEFDGTVSAFSYDIESGLSAIADTVSIQPEGFEGKKDGAHVVVGSDGRFVYAANRSSQTIACFAVDLETGRLRLVSHTKTLGIRPRDFIFDPSGRFLLVTHQHSSSIVSFHVDPNTGELSPTGHSATTHAPNCVVF